MIRSCTICWFPLKQVSFHHWTNNDTTRSLYVYHTHMVILTSPLMRTQSSWSVMIAGFPNSQLVKVTVEWSLQSNSLSVFLSFSPIQSSSVDAADVGRKNIALVLLRVYREETRNPFKAHCLVAMQNVLKRMCQDLSLSSGEKS